MSAGGAKQAGDKAARERIRESLGESLIVEASAGTGKTTELIRRIERVLASGATRVEKVVAVTFTHKAAGELKIRLRQALDRARTKAVEEAERRNLEDALERLEEATIGTIHGFCAQILRERPVEAAIDPDFEELTEQEAERLYNRAFDRWFQDTLEAGAPGLRRALARLAWRESRDAATPVEQLRMAGWKLVGWRDFPAPWRREPFDREGRIDALTARAFEIQGQVAQCPRAGDTLVKAMLPLAEMAAWVERAERARSRDYDTVEALLLKLERELKRDLRKGSGSFAPGIARGDVVAARDALLADLDRFRTEAGADLAAQLKDEMQGLVSRYTDTKNRAGKLDFVDLLLLVRNLVRDNRDVREYLQTRFDRIFVDEFQDTDPLQAEILVLLASSDGAETDWMKVTPAPGKLFLVGDPKQSIYKFRRAEVVLYESVAEALEARGVARVRLTTSFRSVPPLQEMVNAAFEREMTGDKRSGQAQYAPLEEHTPAFDAQPAIVVLPAPKPYGAQRVSKEKINACLPDTIGAFVEWMVRESGWQVRDPQNSGERVPLQAKHICVLFRRMVNFGEDISRDYVRALEARGIPHLLVGSKSFHHREEVETMRAALTAVEWPGDELSVFATLRGSLFAIPDDVLLRFRFEAGRLNPFRKLPGTLAPEFAPVAEALGALASLHRERNQKPIADTINALLDTTRAHAGFALRRAGTQALANVYHIRDLARAFELTGGLSFRGFVEELTAQAEKAESPEPPVLEEAADGVRLMTVHGAKGLEFPVVVLADMTANLAAKEADRYLDPAQGLCATRLLRCAPRDLIENERDEHDRELAEGVRVAYVAATRARDLLVVPAVGDEERDGWLAPLNKAIYPERADYRKKERPAAGCPEFRGDATVLDRPFDYCREPEFSVRPGAHRPQKGRHRIVWWDPAALSLEAPEGFGLRQEEILAAEPKQRAGESVTAYDTWSGDRARALERGQEPAYRILLPTEDAAAPPRRTPVRVESVAERADRPGGRRFGLLVHAVMRDLDLRGSPEQIAALAGVHGRLLGAPQEETAAAEEAVRAAWSHPIVERARRAARSHREWPFAVTLEDGRMLEGAIDLAFQEDGGWLVVDFKSDAFMGPHISRYERQVQWYVYAVSELTGEPAAGYLLTI